MIYEDQMKRGRTLTNAIGTLLVFLVFIGNAGAFSAVSEKLWNNYTCVTDDDLKIIHTAGNFTFAQLSDIHIGYFSYPLGSPQDMKNSVVNFTDTQQAVKRENPELLVITGDLVEYDNKDFFMAFKNLLKSIGIPIYTTPGNHDRRNELTGDNLTDYNTYIKPMSNPSSSDNNYSFDFKGYRFIGLDSGADYSSSKFKASNANENMTISLNCPLLICDDTPESNGLSNEQLTRLEGEFNISSPKIVFMHHAVMSYVDDFSPIGNIVLPDGAPGGNDGTIAINRWNFINYTRDSNVQLVLTGHSHNDVIFNISGTQVSNKSLNMPLFIQTRSATKYENPGYGYRIIEVKDGKANPYNSISPPRYNRVTGEVYLNYADAPFRFGLHAYDSKDRHTGMNPDCSDIQIGIPDSYYTGDYGGNSLIPQILVGYSGDTNNKTTTEFKILSSNCLAANASNTVKSVQPTGISFNMTIEDQTETTTVDVDFYNVNFTANSTSTINVGMINNYSMDIDMNGDGMIEKIIYPDSISSTPLNPQSNISIIAYNNAGIINIASSSGSFTNAASLNASTIHGKPDYEFPFGLLVFRISGLNYGKRVNLTITLPQNLNSSAEYWKYGMTLENITPHWYILPPGSNDGDNLITLELQDGGIGDDDGIANGIIMDAGGPGIAVQNQNVLVSITISPASATPAPGQTLEFSATGKDVNGNVLSINPVWGSNNTSVGTIASTGIFTAAAAGTTTITATSGSIVSNSATVTVVIPGELTGDINGDNIVNYKDLGVLGASYGLSLGDAGYNANADLNIDGIVDYRDLGILGAHYGEQK